MSMTKIRTLVVDDEPIARLAIVRLLSEDCGMELVGECGDGASALNAIRELAPDLVFLDIKMPALSGIDVATQIGHKRGPVMVFVTAYERYAVRAFEANAVDYLVKPFSRERFFVTLARVKRRLASTDAALEEAASQQVLRALSELRREQDYLERIPVPVDEHLVFVEVRDIDWIEANRNLARLQADANAFVEAFVSAAQQQQALVRGQLTNDLRFIAHNHIAFHHVFQFADISRPGILHHPIHGKLAEHRQLLAIVLAVFFEEIFQEYRDLFTALA